MRSVRPRRVSDDELVYTFDTQLVNNSCIFSMALSRRVCFVCGRRSNLAIFVPSVGLPVRNVDFHFLPFGFVQGINSS